MIFEIIMTILVSLIEFLMLIFFINVSDKNKTKSVLINIFYIICFNIINIFISNKILSLLIYFIINYIHIIHNLKYWKKNLLNISLYNIFKIIGIAFVICIISSLNSSVDINTLFKDELLNIVIISNNLTLILLKFYLYKKRYELYEFNIFKILYFLLVSILCLFLSIIIYHISLNFNINNDIIHFILFILLFINFIILNILDSYYDNLIETTKDKIINRQIENERDYFVDLVSNYKISNKEVHDLKNKLYLIKDLINKDNVEIFNINILELSLYQSEINGNYLYSLWTKDVSMNEIKVDEYCVVNISFHNAFDEIPCNIYEEDLYIKIIYYNDDLEYFYAVSKIDNFNTNYFDDYIIYSGDEFYVKSYLDYSLNLRTVDVCPTNSIEYYNFEQNLDSKFSLENYLDNFTGNSKDDNAIINIIPKTDII